MQKSEKGKKEEQETEKEECLQTQEKFLTNITERETETENNVAFHACCKKS